MDLIAPELKLVQFFVGAALFHQRIMGAGFGDPAARDNRNAIGVAYGGKPVSNNQRGSSLAQLIKRLLDQHFGCIVKRTGCFIKNEDGRVLQKHARDGNPLLLTA